MLRGKRASELQKEFLVAYLEQHLELVQDRNDSECLSRDKNIKWGDVAVELNRLGGANKTGTKWWKFWKDQKKYIKDRYEQIREGKDLDIYEKPIKPLSDLEHRILSIVRVVKTDGCDISYPKIDKSNNIRQKSPSSFTESIIDSDIVQVKLEEISEIKIEPLEDITPVLCETFSTPNVSIHDHQQVSQKDITKPDTIKKCNEKVLLLKTKKIKLMEERNEIERQKLQVLQCILTELQNKNM